MLKVLTAGIYSSIQDLGRYGYLNRGVPVSGVMDHYTAKLSNLLIGNDEGAAVLEITMGCCSFEFLNHTVICITGAGVNAVLNDKEVVYNHPLVVKSNSVLKFGKVHYGVRTYIAVKGGFQNKEVLNSRSFFREITKKYILKKNDEILYNSHKNLDNLQYASVKTEMKHFSDTLIEVYKGPEYDLLKKSQKEFLEETTFTISTDNNRMGYKLKETLINSLEDILTSAVLPGTVQLTPSGTLIILMRDAGVTGGYPRVLQLTFESINKLAQKSTNDTFQFKLVDLEQ